MTRRSGVYLAVAAVAVAGGVIYVSSRHTLVPDTVFDQLRCVRRAEAFLKAIGVKADHFENAKLEPPDSDGAPWYWDNREAIEWQHVSVDVGRSSGIVCSYFDHRKATDRGGPPAVRDKNAAMARAKAILAASGQTSELGAPVVHVHDSKRLGRYWSVSWPRIYNGVPYWDDSVDVNLNADGKTSFTIHFRTNTQPTGSARLSRYDALPTAAQCLRDNKVSGAILQSAVLNIVLPNRKWRPPDSVPPLPKSQSVDAPKTFPDDPDGKKAAVYAELLKAVMTPEDAKERNLELPVGGSPRIVWVCKYETKQPKANHSYFVWVDAELGQIVGGMAWDLD